MIKPFSCISRAGNVFTRTLNGFGQWSNKILLLRNKKEEEKKYNKYIEIFY
jgi:hypothetical protein